MQDGGDTVQAKYPPKLYFHTRGGSRPKGRLQGSYLFLDSSRVHNKDMRSKVRYKAIRSRKQQERKHGIDK